MDTPTNGLVITFDLDPEAQAAKEHNAWLFIHPDNRVTVFTGKVEAGQWIRTSLAQIVAEELTLPFDAVEMVMGDTARVPYDGGTYGSLTTRTNGITLRAAAAKAREVLVQLAADKWRVTPADIVVRQGRVALTAAPHTSCTLGEVTADHGLGRTLEGEPVLRPVEKYMLVGKSVPLADGRALVTGAAQFAADLRLPNLAYGAILHPPSFGAKLKQLDARAVKQLPGVIAVVQEGDLVGVVAERLSIARHGVSLLQAEWIEPAQHPAMSTLFDDFRQSASLSDIVVEDGTVEAALRRVPRRFAEVYRTAYVAHAPIETHASVASVEGDTATIYPATQCPFRHRDVIAEVLRTSTDKVRVIMPAVGAGFGGKHQADLSMQAARLSRAVKRPVCVAQTREEEFIWNYVKPAALIEIKSAVNDSGQITAWDCDIYNPGARGAVPPYDFANRRIRTYGCNSPLRQGSYRGLAGSANCFAYESHMDHMARQLGQDPVEFRLRHLNGNPRLANTVKAVADQYGWKRRTGPTGKGVGFACGVDAGSCVAQIVEIDLDRVTGVVRVKRVLVAHESGLVINPDGVENQIIGAIVMGIGLALTEVVRYEDGKIVTDSFITYRIPTFVTAPPIDVILVSNPTHPPQGAGEPAIFPIAAALAAAIYDATGKTLRELPLTPERILATQT